MNKIPNTNVTRLVLVRHGQPSDEIEGRCYGWVDVGLSPDGVDQAEALASHLRQCHLAAVYSSPLRRALDTAIPIANAQGLSVVSIDSLKEINFGDFEGQSYKRIRKAYPTLYEQWMTDPTQICFPGGESYDDLCKRVLPCVEQLVELHRGKTLALVSHGGVNRVVIANALTIAHEKLFRIGQAYGALNRIAYFEGMTQVELVNGSVVST